MASSDSAVDVFAGRRVRGDLVASAIVLVLGADFLAIGDDRHGLE